MVRVATNLCPSYGTDGSFAKIPDVAPHVIALLEKSHREHDSFGLEVSPYAALQAFYGLSLGALGKFAEGERSCEKALSLARDINHLYSIGVAEYLYGALFSYKGDGENMVKHERGAVECLEKS
jgi:hypothetical protein